MNMDNLNTVCSKWGSMAVICLACGAMVYQEHIRSCSGQPSANDIKNSLKHGMKKHFKCPSISNWPFFLSLLIIYVAAIVKFQTLPIASGGFITSIVIYHVVGSYLQNFRKVQSKHQTQSCDFVSSKYLTIKP